MYNYIKQFILHAVRKVQVELIPHCRASEGRGFIITPSEFSFYPPRINYINMHIWNVWKFKQTSNNVSWKNQAKYLI